jgi:hypothetical protein
MKASLPLALVGISALLCRLILTYALTAISAFPLEGIAFTMRRAFTHRGIASRTIHVYLLYLGVAIVFTAQERGDLSCAFQDAIESRASMTGR